MGAFKSGHFESGSKNSGTLDATFSSGMLRSEPIICAPPDLRVLMDKLGLSNVTQYELDEIFEDGMHYMQACPVNFDDVFLVTQFLLLISG